MSNTKIADSGKDTYRAKVTGRHAITLPAELCRRLSIETGDTVEIRMQGDAAVLNRTSSSGTPRARGILKGYFASREDVERYVAEERERWDQREEELSRIHPMPSAERT